MPGPIDPMSDLRYLSAEVHREISNYRRELEKFYSWRHSCHSLRRVLEFMSLVSHPHREKGRPIIPPVSLSLSHFSKSAF